LLLKLVISTQMT